MSADAAPRHRRRLERRSLALGRRVARLDARLRRLAAIRLVSALAAAAAPIAAWLERLPWSAAAVAAACGVAAFAVAAALQGRPRRLERIGRALWRHAEEERVRQRGGWSALRDGSGLAPRPDLAEDLALTGHWSLFQHVSRCATRRGEAALAEALGRGAPATDLAARQAAVRELRRLSAFRHRLRALGSIRTGEPLPPDLDRRLPRRSLHDGRPWIATLAAITAGLSAAALVLAFAGGPSTPLLGLAALHFAVHVATRRAAASEYEELLRWGDGLRDLAAMFELVERRRFEADLLAGLREEARRHGASQALARLARLADWLSVKHSLMHPVLNALCAWDLLLTAALARWRRRPGRHVARWLELMGEVEALSSLGAHAASLPVATFPALEADGPAFEAAGLRHPLLPPETAVGNDLDLAPGTLLLLTGSNMSGKSTLLRAIGANTALALAGGAVHADSLRLRPCLLMTSIHVADALESGVSLFHAEVRRLKALLLAVEAAERDPAAPPVLYLVDEVLRGTNTRERLVAARSVIRTLARSRSAGVVTSHDLSLVELEARVPGVRNAHLREQVEGGRMTFDYVLRPGPVTTTNALAILRLEGIPIDEGD